MITVPFPTHGYHTTSEYRAIVKTGSILPLAGMGVGAGKFSAGVGYNYVPLSLNLSLIHI